MDVWCGEVDDVLGGFFVEEVGDGSFEDVGDAFEVAFLDVCFEVFFEELAVVVVGVIVVFAFPVDIVEPFLEWWE